MPKNYGADSKSALQAKIDAQKIAFAPIVFHAVKALRDLDILKILEATGKQGSTPREISQQLNLSVYGIKVLLDAGLSAEVVYLKNDKYFLSKTGYFFLNDSMTNINMDFVNDVCYNGMYYLKDSIKSKTPEGLRVFGNWPTIYHGLSELPEKTKKSWFAFDHFYSDNVFNFVMPEIFKNKPANILDIGGNTGKFSTQCARYNKDVKITILDLQSQLNVALANVKESGFTTRITGFALDILNHEKPIPGGFDVIWMSQFLDCFSEEDILSILKRVRHSMDSDTSLFILETFWDNQKFDISTFCLNNTSLYFTALANGTSRMYHSEDFIQLIKKTGLKLVNTINDLGISHTLLECKKI